MTRFVHAQRRSKMALGCLLIRGLASAMETLVMSPSDRRPTMYVCTFSSLSPCQEPMPFHISGRSCPGLWYNKVP